MKIVIDIPRKTYNEIKEATMITCGETFAKKLIRYIRNGTPLPEHHGDIVDVKELRYKVDDNGKVVITAPPIIEGSESE